MNDQLKPPAAPPPCLVRDEDLQLDAAIGAARSEGPDAREAESALRRAWTVISESGNAAAGCAAFLEDLARLADGSLGPARASLHGAHASECVSCRHALSAARAKGAPVLAAATTAARTRVPKRILLPLAAAVAGVAAALAFFANRPADDLGAGTRLAEAQGQVFVVDGVQRELTPGDTIASGALVRTAKDARATLELADGSRVELNERTEVSVQAEGDATAVRLSRGDVIVAAAQRRERNLFVDTADCRIAVKGTIFTVEHGLKGSRVGVLEGEVHVDDRRSTHVLRPGQQVSTRDTLTPTDLAEQVRWSQSAGHYAELLRGLDELSRSLQQEPLARNIRHSSELLPALPREAVAYAALPNTPGNFSRMAQLVRERLTASPELRRMWDRGADSGGPSLDDLLRDLERLSSAVGNEIVLAMVLDPSGGSAGPVPVLLAEVSDAGEVKDALAGLKPADGTGGPIVTWDRQRLRAEALVASERDGELRVVLDDRHLVATPSAALAERILRSLDAPAKGVPPTDFFRTIEEQYRAGTEMVLAVDLERIVEHALSGQAADPVADPAAEAFQSAARNLRHFVVTSGEAEDRATLTFKESREGLASWLAEPAPMGGLQFVTPDASAVLSVVVKDPELLVADLRRAIGEVHLAKGLREFQERTGLDLLADVAAPLGGEVTLALDGPLLPRPSWKLIVEVYDPARLTSALERSVERAREEAASAGQPGPSLETIKVLGSPALALRHPALPGEVCLAFRDGYLIACPGRALLEAALQAQELGASFLASPALARRLPKGSDGDLSLLLWQDLGPQLAPWLDRLGVSGAAGGSGGAPGDSALLVQGRATATEVTLSLSASDAGAGGQLAAVLRHATLRALLAELAEGPAEPSAGQGTSL